MTQWRIVPSDGSGGGSIDTLPSDVTVVDTMLPPASTTTVVGVSTMSTKSDAGSGRVVAGVGLIGIGAAVAVAWWVRALRSA